MLPRRLNGGEGTPTRYLEIVETVAREDASAGWVLSQTIVAGVAAFYLKPEIARTIFGPPDAVVAWGSAPNPVAATAVAGGYRVTGVWTFSSGCRHATWLGAHCAIAGTAEERTLLFPKDSARLTDMWHVLGLRATASDSYAVEDLFVPADYTITSMYRWPGKEAAAALAARFSATGLYAPGTAAVALGNARGLLGAVVDLARKKIARTAAAPLGESEVVQTTIAEADTRLAAARTHLYDTIRLCEEAAGREGAVPLDLRMRSRAASTFAILAAGDAVTALYRLAGSTAIFEAEPFERRFRDAYTLSQQIQSRANHYATVGRHLLGLDVDMRWI